ncbi:PLD nuclease N-terminal domain-containing protein [Saccharothrix luteola]|uniref:PLD nuclease N-terminal domain-containing protein n=1 Tax=Saccharothrix luteola TaxID=2893018 RepID=UPI001E4F027B|nr:PLD nuclease N-terminal domain-containing protein [Saccharothrix luteola]MCC8249766.1 PLD nuclease N-terminal domain-containing protein [Saccharothrix luteola]
MTTPLAAVSPFAQEDDGVGGAEIAVIVLLIAIGIAVFVLWVAAIVSVLRSRRLTGGGKLLWIAVVLAFPFLGSIGWFAGGRDARLIRDAGPAAPFPDAR